MFEAFRIWLRRFGASESIKNHERDSLSRSQVNFDLRGGYLMLLSFEDLWKRLNESDETVEIEAKTAQQIGSSLQETISALSNEPGRSGGYLLLGVRRVEPSLFGDGQYDIVGVADPDKIQSDLATMCRSAFNVVVRPQLQVHTTSSGKNVVAAFVPEAHLHEKPVYIAAKGLPKGAFRRIGSTDQHCTDDDVQARYQSRSHRSFDESIMTDCSIDDLDPLALAEYRRNRAETNPGAPEIGYSDEDLLLTFAPRRRLRTILCRRSPGCCSSENADPCGDTFR